MAIALLAQVRAAQPDALSNKVLAQLGWVAGDDSTYQHQRTGALVWWQNGTGWSAACIGRAHRYGDSQLEVMAEILGYFVRPNSLYSDCYEWHAPNRGACTSSAYRSRNIAALAALQYDALQHNASSRT